MMKNSTTSNHGASGQRSRGASRKRSRPLVVHVIPHYELDPCFILKRLMETLGGGRTIVVPKLEMERAIYGHLQAKEDLQKEIKRKGEILGVLKS
jgi:hypothetical protein